MKRWIAGLLLVAGLLVGLACQRLAPGSTGVAGLAGLPFGSGSGNAGGQAGSGVGADSPTSTGVETPRAYGFLDIHIRWPKESVGTFNAQLIPQSTNRVDIVVKDQLLATVATASVTRLSAGDTAATASLRVLANSLDVEARAFRVVDGVATEIARANAVRVTVLGNSRSLARLTLGALFAPTITGLSPQAARDGDTVTITGTNLGAFNSPFGGSRVPDVYFNGTKALTVTAVDAAKVQAVVPAGASVGGVSIVHDGATSSSTAIFYLASSLTATASAKASWDPTAADTRMVLLGGELGFTASPSWTLKVGDALANYPSPPGVVWEVGNANAGTIDASGQFVAGSQYATASVSCRYGSRRSNAFTVSAEDVTVTLSPATGAVGPAGDAQVAFAALNVFSSGATNNLVDYAADNASVSVTAAGVATATDSIYVGYGRATVAATSKILGTRKATASLDVANWWVSTVAGSGNPNFKNGVGAEAEFKTPYGIAVAPDGTIYVADYGYHCIRKIVGQTVTTFAGIPGGGGSDTDGSALLETRFFMPTTLALLPDGKMMVFNYGDLLLKLVDPAANAVTTLVDGDWTVVNGPLATANMGAVHDVTVSSAGTVYFMDQGKLIRRIQNGNMEAVAGGFSPTYADGPAANARFNLNLGMAFDAAEQNLYIADGAYNRRIRKLNMATQTVSTVAGNGATPSVDAVGTAAQFNNPVDVEVDKAGNLWISDQIRLRRMSPDGTVKTITGQATEETAGFQDGIAAFARFKNARWLAMAPDGTLYISDTDNHRIRKIVRVP